MTDNDPIGRAQVDRQAVTKQIAMLDAEILRLAQQKTKHVTERDRLTAFIELFSKYTTPEPVVIEAVATIATATDADALPTPPPVMTSPKDAAKEPPPKSHAAPKKAKRRKGIAHKPKTAPSMPNMIREALEDAQKRGVQSLDSRGMQAFIAEHHWAGVTVARIRPVAWRMSNESELRKVSDGVYALPEPEPEGLVLKAVGQA